MLGLLLCCAAINYLENAPYFHSGLDGLCPLAGALPVVATAIAFLALLNRQAMSFARDFTQASSVSRFACPSERQLGTLIAQDRGPLFLRPSALISLEVAAYLCRSALTSSRPVLVMTLAVLSLTAYGMWRHILLLVFWRFRRAHGRAPTDADLRSIDPPGHDS